MTPPPLIMQVIAPLAGVEGLLAGVSLPYQGPVQANVADLALWPALDLAGPGLVLDAEIRGDWVVLSLCLMPARESEEEPMSRLCVFLDRQHAGKPARPDDRGAWGDLDHDGHRDLRESEALWTGIYLHAAEVRLMELGHAVIPISDGSYAERHARVNHYAARYTESVYIAAHLNSLTGGSRGGSGSGDYGSVFYDHRSSEGNGDALAASIGRELGRACPEIARVKFLAASPSSWDRAYSTIRGLGKPVGICFEPAFIDYQPHQDSLFTPEGMARIGTALADGIHAWHLARAGSTS